MVERVFMSFIYFILRLTDVDCAQYKTFRIYSRHVDVGWCGNIVLHVPMFVMRLGEGDSFPCLFVS